MSKLHRIAGLVALGLAFVASAAFSAEPPVAPILRLEAGTHTGTIWSIATDRDYRLLASASNDKTVRIWELATGRLLQVLRPPQGTAEEGAMYSVALSPNGDLVAAGGNTGFQWDRTSAIYVFRRTSGVLVTRITGPAQVPVSLSWSRDGRYLAAGFSGQAGVHVYRTDTFAQIGADSDYGERTRAEFAADGRLMAASHDGTLRVYRVSDSGLTLLVKQRASGGKEPQRPAISPDGRRIAVGFDDVPRVEVYSSDTLSLLTSASTADVAATRNLISVAWSADGEKLYAAGNYSRSDDTPIRVWPERGAGAHRDLPGSANTVLQMISLPGNRIAYSGSNEWGVVSDSGTRLQRVVNSTADFRNSRNNFFVSRDGSQVSFGYKRFGSDPALFDIANGVLRAGAPTPGLRSPALTASGIEITDWMARRDPKINGKPITLVQFERSLAIALPEDGQSVLVGGDYSVSRFDRDGTRRWRRANTGDSWAVNLSADARIAVAALGDGTIRWYNYADGKELLALFPHADQKRWIMWTPSGYYDASPGAEDLVGWHLNRGKEGAADFFPASRFRGQYYRPDVVAKVLGTGDEAEAVRIANLEAGRRQEATRPETALPPVVEILSPTEGSGVAQSNVTLRFAVRTAPDAPVMGLRARVNGQSVTLPEARNLVVKNAESREVTIAIPEADSEIMLFAENRHGVSTPATLRVAWRGQRQLATEEFSLQPKLYVLAVGVSKYQRKDLQLDFAAKDATDFAQALRAQKGRLYREVNVKLLIDAAATRDDILDGLEWIRKEVTAKDVAMVFFAGHGLNDPDGRYYFLPSNTDPDRLRRTGVLFHEIRDTLNVLPGKTVLFVDTCHSGNVLGTGRRAADITGVLNELTSAENGVVVFTASTGRQYSLENPAWNNGAFTKAVVEGLLGSADYKKTGRITFKMLDFYISDRVKELTKNQQTPVTIVPNGVPDFPLTMNSGRSGAR